MSIDTRAGTGITNVFLGLLKHKLRIRYNFNPVGVSEILNQRQPGVRISRSEIFDRKVVHPYPRASYFPKTF